LCSPPFSTLLSSPPLSLGPSVCLHPSPSSLTPQARIRAPREPSDSQLPRPAPLHPPLPLRQHPHPHPHQRRPRRRRPPRPHRRPPVPERSSSQQQQPLGGSRPDAWRTQFACDMTRQHTSPGAALHVCQAEAYECPWIARKCDLNHCAHSIRSDSAFFGSMGCVRASTP